MSQLVDERLIESIRIEPVATDRAARPVGRTQGPPELLVLTSTLEYFNWSDMLYVASGVLDREGIGSDGTGFRYPTDERDPGEEPWEGVEIYNPLGEIHVSVPAFERLMLRYFRLLLDAAEVHGDPVLQRPFWPQFVEMVAKLEQRCAETA